MTYLVTKFTPDMLCFVDFALVRFDVVDPSTIPDNVYACIDDKKMLRVLSSVLGFEIKNSKETVNISDSNDTLYLTNYYGPKLDEDATKLPKDGQLRFYKEYIE